MKVIRRPTTAIAIGALAALAACAPRETGPPQPANPSAEAPPVRAAHDAVSNPDDTYVDELGMEFGIPINHPAVVHPGTDDFPTGPAVGERLPDFTLPNQHGEMIDFQQHHAGQKAVLVFYRSAVW